MNFCTRKNIVDFKSGTAGHYLSPAIEHWTKCPFQWHTNFGGRVCSNSDNSSTNFFQPPFLITCSHKPVCFLLSALPHINMEWQKTCQLTNLMGWGNSQWKVADWTWTGLQTSYNILPAHVHVKPTFKNRDPPRHECAASFSRQNLHDSLCMMMFRHWWEVVMVGCWIFELWQQTITSRIN